MPPVGSKEEFIKHLRASKILSEEQLAGAISKNETDDPKQFALALVRAKLISQWQAKFLLSGRHNLRLGNFLLIKRLRQDELGDRFKAKHESLDRMVEIQVLPTAVSKNSEMRDPFVKSIGQITDIDHPHISHIHDIDQQGGRFFLVDEHLDGIPLKETIADGKSLVRCSNQILKAIGAVHENGIMHGELNEENIVALANGQFKLNGMGLSLLRRQLKGQKPPSGEDDIRSFCHVLQQRFELLEENEKSEFSWLNDRINDLKANPTDGHTELLKQTDELINKWKVASEKNDEIILSPPVEIDAGPKVKDPLNRSAGVMAGSRKSKSSKSFKRKKPSDPSSEKTPPWFTNPVFIGAVGLAGVLLVVGGLWMGGLFGSKKNDKGVSKVNSIPNTKNVVENKESNDQKTESKRVNKINHGKLDLDPDKIKKQLEEKKKELAGNQNQPEPTPQKPAPPKPGENENKIAAPEQPTKVVDLQPKNEPPGNGKENPVSTANNSAPKAEEPEEKKAPNLFADWPKSIDFPNPSLKTDFSIAEFNGKVEQVSLNLLTSPDSFGGKGKGTLAIQKTDNEWNLVHSVKSDDVAGAQPVGKFRLDESELIFQWNENTSKSHKSNYIRNCLLQVTADQQSRKIPLREPMAIESLALTPESYSKKINLADRYLPVASAIKIEVIKPAKPWPKTFKGPDKEFNGKFQFNENLEPLTLAFDPDPVHQKFGIVIIPELKPKSISLVVGVGVNSILKGQPTNVPLENRDSIVALFDELHQEKEVWAKTRDGFEAEADVYRKQGRRDGSIGNANEKAKKARLKMEAAQKSATEAGEARDLFDELHGIDIPMQVYFMLGDRKVIIAQTEAVEPTELDD